MSFSAEKDAKPTQRELGPPSGPGALWVGASLVGDRLYLCDFQTRTLQRLIDSDGDGALDLVDPDFSVRLPGNFVQATEGPVTGHDCFPLEGFTRFGTEVITILRSERSHFFCEQHVEVRRESDSLILTRVVQEPDVGGVFLSYTTLLKRQRRIFVKGTPGVHFTLECETSDGVVSEIASRQEIGVDGKAIVELEEPLVANTRVRAVAQTTGARSTNWRRVEDVELAVLFRTWPRDFMELETVRLEGDLLPMKVEGKYQIGRGDIESCEVTCLNSGAVSLRLPDLGARGQGPTRMITTLSLWLEDPESGEALTRPIELRVMHN